MQGSSLVLASVALGIVVGVLAVGTVVLARAAGRRRAEAMYPSVPPVVIEILDELGSFAVLLDSSLSPVYANGHAREHETITGEQLRTPAFLAQARSVLTTGEPFTSDPDEDDEEYGTAIWMHLFRLGTGFVVVLASDRGEERRLNAMRRDFIANMSHELKTPISAISLLAEAVREASDEPELVRGFSKSLVRESQRLSELTRDIIRLSEAQSALGERDREDVQLRELVRNQVESYRTIALQRGVDIVLTEPEDTDRPAVTRGRPQALGIAVSNLLSNAIKHSPDGGHVGIGMEFEGQTLSLAITDQGPGIAESDLERVFERFFRTDDARTRSEGGTGLGLSIVKHTMLSHGGDVQVWSQPGVGSTFSLLFPLVAPESEEQIRAAKKRAKAKKKAKAKRAGSGITPVSPRTGQSAENDTPREKGRPE